jgi:hypothetical protein
MLKRKTKILDGDSVQTCAYLFGIRIFSMLIFDHGGWFRLFGKGLTWCDNTIKPMFSERVGKTKKITVGKYRYGYLK